FRIGVGIGEAGVLAPATALIGDHFPAHRRGFALTVMRLGFPLGAAFGSFFGAWIGATHGWRAAMLAVSLPGIVMAILFRVLLREPVRGMSDTPDQQREAAVAVPMRQAFAAILGRSEFRHMLLGLGVATMGLYSAGAFNVPFFMRVHGLSLAKAGSYLGIISTVSSLIGMSIGGLGIDLIARRGMRWYALVPAIGLVITAPVYFYAYMAAPPFVSMLCLLSGGIFLFFHSVPTLVAMQNLVASNVRATAAFLYFFVQTLIGVGFGPPITGLLSDMYASHALGSSFGATCHQAVVTGACAVASAYGVRMALGTSCLFFLWGAAHYFVAARRLAAVERGR
ncbi:MAG: MFS transporter, partial [Janthinobacterium lividum]